MSAINAFDNVAPFYDSLKRLVFGRILVESQLAFLTSMKNASRVLLIGGGTGEVLEALLKMNEKCKVWYVEASSAMILRAKKRIGPCAARVNFIHGSEDLIPTDVEFDAIITGFFLDLFEEERVGQLACKFGQHLGNDGLWLIIDFVRRRKWWQDLLLWSMYRFFVVTCRIDARRLPSWEDEVSRNGFREIQSKSYLKGFVKSSVWTKAFPEKII